MHKRYIGDKAFYKRVMAIVVPIIIQNGITNFVSLLDNIMVGQVGTLPMSGVSIVNQLLFVFNLCIFGATAGAGIFTAQFQGSGDTNGIRHTFRFKFLICLGLTAVGITLFLAADTPLISLFLTGDGNPEDAAAILEYGRAYLRMMLIGLLPFALTNAYAGTLKETGETVVPMLGGIAIRDIDADETKTLGFFSPAKHDGGGYMIQSSYSFVGKENRIVCPTSHNHLLILEATDQDGNVLPEFRKLLDIDIKAAAEAALGKTLDQKLLAVVFDYEGNLWFATGGFRIYPDRGQQGTFGYIAADAIEAILQGQTPDLSEAVYVYDLLPGEGAENGIAASKDGAVILTNQNCYLLRANNGVEAVWCTPYESVGAKVSGENDKTTGGGLTWGGGCSPSLTPDLVMFTDNADPVKLLALDMKTGEIVASMPVLDDLPEGYQVAVENSAIVYDDSEGTVSTIVCNWFGAGSAGLADPTSDSSIQSYANIYDTNWLTKGNCMIAPGVERVDTIKTDSGYEMKSIWCRNDLSDTSIMKLSTATGYIYGYVQDLESGMWQYIILDFATGETVLTMDVSNKYGYNNMAIGMYAGNSGNALYCPTGYLELLCLQDRFVYLPEMPYRKVDLDKSARNVLTQEQFEQAGGEGTVASWRNTVTVENVHPNTTVSFRMNNLSGSAADLKLYAYGADGKLAEVSKELWTITDESGTGVDTLTDGTLYELRVSVADDGALDLSEAEKEIIISVVLSK